LIRRPDGLAVEHGGAWGCLASSPFAVFEQQRMVEAIPDAFAFPSPQVVIDGLPRREVVRQKPLGAPGAQQIEDGVHDLALFGLARAASGAGVGDHGRNGGPLVVSQVGGVVAAAGQSVDPSLRKVDAP